ncbi:MAG: N-acetylmuramoyl-L-alanine amidase, partial [Acidobacteria bacterium]
PPPAPAATGAGVASAPAAEPRFAAPAPLEGDVLPLAVRRIVLDPGHGGEDTGALSAPHEEPRLSEKELTLDIARRLEQKLLAAGFEVVMTRRDDATLSLRQRAAIANRAHADLFVSIHVNWIAQRRVLGVETYHVGPTDDPYLEELARRENHDSGYTLADLRQLLDGIYADVRQDESRQLAAHVQRALYHQLLPQSPKLADRGVKTAPFVVLVATEMPAILAEVSCLSNREEARRLARPRYREHIARALLRGIETYADDVNQTEKGS